MVTEAVVTIEKPWEDVEVALPQEGQQIVFLTTELPKPRVGVFEKGRFVEVIWSETPVAGTFATLKLAAPDVFAWCPVPPYSITAA